MATPVERRLRPKSVRKFGSGRDYQLPPDLTKIQTESFKALLQEGVDPEKRERPGHRECPARDLSDSKLRQKACAQLRAL